jgi:hypothetical protein
VVSKVHVPAGKFLTFAAPVEPDTLHNEDERVHVLHEFKPDPYPSTKTRGPFPVAKVQSVPTFTLPHV